MDRPDDSARRASRARMAGQKLAAACWKGYEAIGMKVKDGRRVPNCVPVRKE